MSARYVFHTEWQLAASPDDVYTALHDVGSYPKWWPQVRSVRALDNVTGELRCRSMLPYDLVFVVAREDRGPVRPRAGRAADRRPGGHSRWTIAADGDGTRWPPSTRTSWCARLWSAPPG